jgi:Tol biopolymer transport system component
MTENSSRQNETALESWKEIAAYLKRDVRTVKRWEKAEALPVRRHLHQARSSVYAYASELEAWKAARQPGFDQAVAVMPWRRPIPALGFALTLLLALISVASGPILTPPGAAAQESGGMVTRQVWAGPGVDFHGVPSADGRYLPYTDWETGDLAVRDLLTGENRRLTDNHNRGDSVEIAHAAVPSPDGQQVAYGWFNKEFFYELRVIGIDGSDPRVLYRNEEMAYLQPEAWSPDAKHILAQFTRKDGANQIGWVSVADGSVQMLKTMDWRYPFKVSLSPDGHFIAYDFAPEEHSPQRDIFVLAADGSREIPLVQHPANDLLLGWAPDGKRILFASDRTGSMGLWVVGVAAGAPEGAPKLVKKDIGRVRALGFTRDGAFFYAVPTGMSDVYIATLDLATGTLLAPPTQATERSVGSTTLPAWSPDGKYLAYVSQPLDDHFSTGLDSRIIIQSVETGEERDFSPELKHIGGIRWSPDGRSLLVVGYDKNRLYNQSLYRMDTQTGDIIPILRSHYEGSIYEAVPSSDGMSIFYHRDDVATKGCHFLVRDLETGREKELLRTVAPSFAGGLALSPDGRQLAFVTFAPAAFDPETRALKVMPAQGGEARELFRVEDKSEYIRGVAWTPDGRHLLFTRATWPSEEPGGLWRVSAEGGEAQKLGLALDGLRDLSVHPGGRQLVFTGGQPYKPEIWVLENFLPKPEAQAAQVKE